jgi:hypothetical protein
MFCESILSKSITVKLDQITAGVTACSSVSLHMRVCPHIREHLHTMIFLSEARNIKINAKYFSSEKLYFTS